MRIASLIEASENFEGNAPDSIVYLPKGEHKISCTVDGRPGTRTIMIDETAVEPLQSALESRFERNVRPIGGFNHKSGPAAFIPKEFSWDPEKGVMLAVDWTRAGREAIEGRDYSYFSPTCLVSDGVPVGLPESGEIGSLTNNPAFEEIERIAAEERPHAEQVDEKVESENDRAMNPLVEIGLLTEEEAAQDNALELAKEKLEKMASKSDDMEKEVEGMKKDMEKYEAEKLEAESAKSDLEVRLEKLEAERKERAEADADRAVAEAIEAGKIAPKDEDTITFYKESHLANPERTEKILASLNVNPALAPESTTKPQPNGKAPQPELSGLELVAAEFAKELNS